MKKLIAILAALAIICASFIAGAWYTIKTARMGYDDGFYIMDVFGHYWIYPDGDYQPDYEETYIPCPWDESIYDDYSLYLEYHAED